MNYLDLFSGGGGFHQGLVQAGFKFDWCGHSEVDKYAEQVYHKHFPESRCLGDVSKIKVQTRDRGRLPHGKDRREAVEHTGDSCNISSRQDSCSQSSPCADGRGPVDGQETTITTANGTYTVDGKINLITFGFPCQDLSVAGKRGGLHASRSGLFFEAMRIVESAKPDIFIFENVKGLLSSSEGRDFEVVLRTIADLGLYDCEWQLVNTRWVLPQNRERIFFVGHLRGASSPKVFPIGEGDQGYENKQRTNVKTTQFDVSGKGYKSQQDRVYHSDGDMSCIPSARTESKLLIFEPEIRAVLTPNRPEKRQNGRRIKEEGEPSFTLTGQDQHGIEITEATNNEVGKDIANAVNCDGYLERGSRGRDKDGKTYLTGQAERRIRRLTPVECERLQGFPDGWTKAGIVRPTAEWIAQCAKKGGVSVEYAKSKISETQRYKIMGNAVTVDIVEMIGRTLLQDYRRSA